MGLLLNCMNGIALSIYIQFTIFIDGIKHDNYLYLAFWNKGKKETTNLDENANEHE